jgi:hypothetical protein
MRDRRMGRRRSRRGGSAVDLLSWNISLCWSEGFAERVMSESGLDFQGQAASVVWKLSGWSSFLLQQGSSGYP